MTNQNVAIMEEGKNNSGRITHNANDTLIASGSPIRCLQIIIRHVMGLFTHATKQDVEQHKQCTSTRFI